MVVTPAQMQWSGFSGVETLGNDSVSVSALNRYLSRGLEPLLMLRVCMHPRLEMTHSTGNHCPGGKTCVSASLPSPSLFLLSSVHVSVPPPLWLRADPNSLCHVVENAAHCFLPPSGLLRNFIFCTLCVQMSSFLHKFHHSFSASSTPFSVIAAKFHLTTLS